MSLLKYFKPVNIREVIGSSDLLNNVTSIEREEIDKQLNEDKSKKGKKYTLTGKTSLGKSDEFLGK